MRSLILAVAVAGVVAQGGAQQFAGSWTAALQGKTYARLELTETNGTLGGRIGLGAMHFDRTGEVTEILRTAGDFTPIFDVALRDGTLLFSRKDEDQIDRFEARFDRGELRLTFILSEDIRAELASQGIAAVKPVRLTRASR